MTQRPAALAADIAIVLVAIGCAWQFTKWVLYPFLGAPENAPMILRPILGFFAAWAVLRWRGERWAGLGLRRPANLWIAAMQQRWWPRPCSSECCIYTVGIWGLYRS